MSKSILVIDTPENCYDCGIRKGYSCGGVSVICGIGKTLPTNLRKPDWCPLRDLPEKKSENKYHNDYERSVIDGFNACIDKILKGANGNE